jgi:predicted TPR repeat methyltransferase
MEAAQMAIDLVPELPQNQAAAGEVFARAGDLERAIATYRRALTFDCIDEATKHEIEAQIRALEETPPVLRKERF